MDMSPQEYQAYVKGMQKKSPLLKDMALAFGIGGAICVGGRRLRHLHQSGVSVGPVHGAEPV